VETIEAGDEAGFGLFSIRERLRLFGGRLEIVSRLDEGTRVILYTPVQLKQASP
jgi:signal transduction histidine kinase